MSCVLQAGNPKDQYLLLKALNEVIVSLTSDMGNKQLSSKHQQEVRVFYVSHTFSSPLNRDMLLLCLQGTPRMAHGSHEDLHMHARLCQHTQPCSAYRSDMASDVLQGSAQMWRTSSPEKHLSAFDNTAREHCACAQVLRLLLANCEVEEECRNVVAECMGHLALLFPAEVLPALLQRHSDPSPSARAAAVTAVKAAVVPEPHPIDDLLKDSIEAFLELVSDPDRHACRSLHRCPFQVLADLPHSLPRGCPMQCTNRAVERSRPGCLEKEMQHVRQR